MNEERQKEDNSPNREQQDLDNGNMPHTVIPSRREPEKSHRDWSRKSTPPPPTKRPGSDSSEDRRKQ